MVGENLAHRFRTPKGPGDGNYCKQSPGHHETGADDQVEYTDDFGVPGRVDHCQGFSRADQQQQPGAAQCDAKGLLLEGDHDHLENRDG